MPTFGLDLMMGRALGFDDVRLDGDELVFTASGSVGAGCRAAYEVGCQSCLLPPDRSSR